MVAGLMGADVLINGGRESLRDRGLYLPVLEITHCHRSLTGHLIRMTMHSCMCPVSICMATGQAQMTFDHTVNKNYF